MANMKRISAAEARKATEQMKAKKKVKITGSASSTPQVSGSMIKSQPKTATKPKASGMSRMLPRSPSKANKTPMPKIQGAKPGTKKLMPRVTNAAPGPRRLLANSALAASAPKRVATAAKKAAAKPKVAKRAPLETKRVGGIFAIPVKPKKTIY
jgi:hypothetical protein